ncbi:MAG: trigger factor [Acidobacteriota bacterium]|nr:trigger factor [Acidobacteriota bacterium]
MKVQVEDLSQVRKRLAIEVPAEEVQSAWDRALRQARREMKFPGFRPGKAPLALVRAQVGKTLGGKVAEALVGRYASEAIREQGLRPIDGGIFLDLARDQEDPPPAEEGESYTFGVLVELPPDFEVEDYAGVKVARPKVEVDTEDVQKELNALRESFATYEPVEGRPSADGDELVLQIEGHEKDGELRLERRASQLRLGDEGNLPEFNEHLASLEVGDSFSFEVQYPDEKRYGDLAGRLMVFSGEIEEIRQRVVPEMDDAWAAGFSDIENLAQLRERMREAIEARRNSEADAVAPGAAAGSAARPYPLRGAAQPGRGGARVSSQRDRPRPGQAGHRPQERRSELGGGRRQRAQGRRALRASRFPARCDRRQGTDRGGGGRGRPGHRTDRSRERRSARGSAPAPGQGRRPQVVETTGPTQQMS